MTTSMSLNNTNKALQKLADNLFTKLSEVSDYYTFDSVLSLPIIGINLDNYDNLKNLSGFKALHKRCEELNVKIIYTHEQDIGHFYNAGTDPANITFYVHENYIDSTDSSLFKQKAPISDLQESFAKARQVSFATTNEILKAKAAMLPELVKKIKTTNSASTDTFSGKLDLFSKRANLESYKNLKTLDGFKELHKICKELNVKIIYSPEENIGHFYNAGTDSAHITFHVHEDYIDSTDANFFESSAPSIKIQNP